ncbi:unnamed protein product [Linum trigynum]|uniref:Uncharacterized protein n=1 Tax=Linum trigynum TaxID=586398 RepID=A0AAV2E4E5_9ROSI
MNLCSKCYREIRVSKEQAASAKAAMEMTLSFKSKKPVSEVGSIAADIKSVAAAEAKLVIALAKSSAAAAAASSSEVAVAVAAKIWRRLLGGGLENRGREQQRRKGKNRRWKEWERTT